MKKRTILIVAAAIITAAGATGCAACKSAFETVKNYDWSNWWSIHKEPLTELAKSAVEAQKTENTETTAETTATTQKENEK